jgi:hypothetical protein
VVTRRPLVTRRAVFAAGAVAVLAGCGEEDGEAPARPVDALLPSLAAERALAAATADGRSLVERVSARARERARMLAAAVSAEGGRPHDAPAPAAGSGDPVARGQAARAAHIAGLPRLGSRELRRLGAELVAGAAADVAVLGDTLGEQAVEAFPGSSP